jgi:hypothetical protein
MISISQTVQYINNVACVISTYYGLSTDTPKPTEGVGNGSAFIEMDTSKVYFFDAGNSEWLEWGAESNAASNAASTLSMTRPSLTLGNTLSPDVVEPDVMEEAVPDLAEEDMPEAADTTEDGEDE